MGPTEWTVIGVGIALLVALGSFVKFVNTSMENRLNANTANLRTEIAGVRTEVAVVRTEIAELRSEFKGDIAGLRAELKGDMADLRAELKGDMADLRSELKLDFQTNRAEIITNRRMLGRFALHRHGEDGLPLAPLTDTLEPPDASGEQPGNENGSD